MSEERLQKILARAGVASRRKAEELIQQGLVTINGRVAELGEKADPGRDAIKVDGKRIHAASEHRYLLLNKPKGVMSTVDDPEGRPTVIDLVPPGLRKALFPVGRLDFDTEGLLLLTDDGDFAQRIAHPRYGSTKTYEVKVKGRPSDEALDRLRAGIVLEGKRTAPCRITPHGRTLAAQRRRSRDDSDGDNTWWRVELTEGRTRQIREMFYRIGHPVQKLRRVAIGPLRDPKLPVGAIRELSADEVEKLLRSAGEPRRAAPRKAAPAKKTAKKTGTATRERRTLAEVSREAGRKPKTPKPRKIARKAAPAKRSSGPSSGRASGRSTGRPSGRPSGPGRGRG